MAKPKAAGHWPRGRHVSHSSRAGRSTTADHGSIPVANAQAASSPALRPIEKSVAGLGHCFTREGHTWRRRSRGQRGIRV